MKDQKGKRDEMFMDKDVTACYFPEIVVHTYKEPTYNVVKDICVDEGVPMMQEKDSIKVTTNSSESKSLEDIKFQQLVDTKEEVKKSSPRDVVAKPVNVSKEALTLRDIISMEDSQNVNLKTEEVNASNLRSVMSERESLLQNNLLMESFDHSHLLSRNFHLGDRSFTEGESGLAHITYSGPISVSGSLSIGSEGSTGSFAFPILQQEWTSSPVRMGKPEKRRVRKEKRWRHYSFLLCCRF